MADAGVGGAKLLVYEYVPKGSLLEYIMGKNLPHFVLTNTYTSKF